MPVQIFNTLTRSQEEITPRPNQGKTLSLYTCGPTVYAYAHIGNFRAYVFEDLLQRQLQTRGYRVRRVMNLTDVDDKTIRGAAAANISLADFTRPFKEAFFADAQRLRLLKAEAYPEATDPAQIKKMIAMIATLLERGHAYQAEDGSVYFRIASFPNYGKLARVDLEGQRPGQRVTSDEYDKEAIADFALWKAWVPEDGTVGWESPWGKGRPGWHIECSAMATGALGETIDIHCGGVDNIFPHHEAEIAQCECAGDGHTPFVSSQSGISVSGFKKLMAIPVVKSLRPSEPASSDQFPESDVSQNRQTNRLTPAISTLQRVRQPILASRTKP